MNFLSHGIPYLNEPLVVVGTALPDWLSVVNRRVRARRRLAEPFLQADDEMLRLVATGIVQHHIDDHWFHGTRAFAETNLQFALELRERLPGDEGFRPTFVGHIVIEMILDGLWIQDDPAWGDRYYASLQPLDPAAIARCLERITGVPVTGLAEVMERFLAARFLYDYQQADTLLMRLNQVMRRVKLAELPPAVGQWLPRAISIVRSRRHDLLAPSDMLSPFLNDLPEETSSR